MKKHIVECRKPFENCYEVVGIASDKQKAEKIKEEYIERHLQYSLTGWVSMVFRIREIEVAE